MIRPISILAVFASLFLATPVHAGGGKHGGGKHDAGKHKGGKKGGGPKGGGPKGGGPKGGGPKGGGPKGGGPGGGGPGDAGEKTIVAGAGQRLHFSFGGRLVLNKTKNKANGKFSIIVHPSAPSGNTLNVTCRYNQFKALTITDNRIEVDARGKCTVLHTDGTLELREADNHITIVDNPSGSDSIDVEVNGSSGGIAIAGGAMSFGDFTFTSTQG